MNKSEFLAAIKIRTNLRVYPSWNNGDAIAIAIKNDFTIPIQPVYVHWCKNYTQTNLKSIQTQIDSEPIQSQIKLMAKRFQQFKRSKKYIMLRYQYQASQLAQQATHNYDEHGGMSGRGDHWTTHVIDFVWKPAELLEMCASGNILALVLQNRTRVYAKSYKGRPSTRSDYYLVGTNENGVPFAHSIPPQSTVREALAWIWDDNHIVARHGDVALANTDKMFKNFESVTGLTIIDNHQVSGDVHRNGSLYVCNAILHHTKNQHPDVHTPDSNKWYKIIIARRSTKSVSSRD